MEGHSIKKVAKLFFFFGCSCENSQQNKDATTHNELKNEFKKKLHFIRRSQPMSFMNDRDDSRYYCFGEVRAPPAESLSPSTKVRWKSWGTFVLCQ